MLRHRYLLYRLRYNPRTGAFVWRCGNARGKVAGTVHHSGYIQISIKGVLYLAHRLAYFYMRGVWPAIGVDHRNRRKGDNRWSNLREATQTQNLQNQSKHRDNTSGYTGVSRCGSKWRAQIGVNRVGLHLGLYSSPVEAHGAYLGAKRRLHEFSPTPEHS